MSRLPAIIRAVPICAVLLLLAACAASTPPPDAALVAMRGQIDRIDAELIQLLGARLAVAKSIGAFKKAQGRAVVDPTREAAVVDRFVRMAAQQQIPETTARAIIQQIIAASRAQQQ